MEMKKTRKINRALGGGNWSKFSQKTEEKNKKEEEME